MDLGNKEISDRVVNEGKVGDTLNIKPKEIEGYIFDEKNSDKLEQKYTQQDREVSLKYSKKE